MHSVFSSKWLAQKEAFFLFLFPSFFFFFCEDTLCRISSTVDKELLSQRLFSSERLKSCHRRSGRRIWATPERARRPAGPPGAALWQNPLASRRRSSLLYPSAWHSVTFKKSLKVRACEAGRAAPLLRRRETLRAVCRRVEPRRPDWLCCQENQSISFRSPLRVFYFSLFSLFFFRCWLSCLAVALRVEGGSGV